MAVTKIWPIKDSIKRVVQYAENPEKTELSDIKRVLNYAENKEKVAIKVRHYQMLHGINLLLIENLC